MKAAKTARVVLALAVVAAAIGVAILNKTHREGTLATAVRIPMPPAVSLADSQASAVERQPEAIQRLLPRLPKTALQALIDDALKPDRRPEDRAFALHIADACMTYPAMPAPTLQAVQEQNGGIAIDAAATLKEVRQARSQLAAFCATGNATELVDRLRQAKLPVFGPVEKSLLLWHGGPRSQEYFQAATQVLANPNSYSVQFDVWLTKDLDAQLHAKYGLDRNASIYVEDALYNEFVTTNNNQPFRLMERCALFGICPSSTLLTDSEAAKAQRVAAQIQSAIQQQRWDMLIPIQ